MSNTTTFTGLEIEFNENDKASVYFAHLQNKFKQLYLTHLQKNYDKQQDILQKIDYVLFDIFFQHQLLQKQYYTISTNLKQMLQQCAQMVNECKSDREHLVKVTQDRQNILQKLKLSTDQSLEITQQNSSLYQQLQKFKQINSLLKQKNNILEEQIENVTTSNKSYQHVVTISKQFQKISNDNISIQKDIADLLISTEIYSKASEPLQIMCLAFQQNPSIRDQLWSLVSSKHKTKFQNIQSTKNLFYSFSYIDALMLFTK